MKESLKNLFLIFSSLLLFFSFVFYLTRPKAIPNYRVTAYLQNAFDDSGHNALKLGMEQAALDYKAEMTFSHFDEELTIKEKEEQLLDEVTKEGQGVILEPTLEQEAIVLPEQGTFVFVNNQIETIRPVPTITADNQKIGKELGEEIYKRNKERTAILLVLTKEMDEEDRANQAGLIQIFDKQQLSYDAVVFEQGVETSLIQKIEEQEYGTIVCLGREASEALGRLKKNQKTLEDIALYGFGFSNDLLNLVDQGVLQGLGVSNQFAVGYAAVAQVIDQLEGKALHLPHIASLIVTKENLFDTDNQKLLFPLIQ